MKDLKTKFVPISSLNRGKAIKVINDMNDSYSAVYIMKNNSPEGVLIPVDAYEEFKDFQFYQKVAERAFEYKTDDDHTVFSQEEMDKMYNISKDDLKDWEDIELEDVDGNVF